MKYIVLLLIFTTTIGYSQIHIGEKSRTIYTFYKQKGDNVKFDNWGTGGKDYLKVWGGGVNILFYFDENDVCASQKWHTRDIDKFYELCDAMKVTIDWKSHKRVYKNKMITCYTYKGTDRGERYYSIDVSVVY